MVTGQICSTGGGGFGALALLAGLLARRRRR
jgi:MYXO-CTERM domain-containing protein